MPSFGRVLSCTSSAPEPRLYEKRNGVAAHLLTAEAGDRGDIAEESKTLEP